MTIEKYVKKIVKKIKCPKNKKREIKQQLLSDISIAQENGESPSHIMARMGQAASIAAEFNENITPEERKKYKHAKILKIVIFIFAILAVLVLGIYWLLPKERDLKKSSIYTESMIKTQMQNVIEWVGEEDYEQLRAHSISALQPFFQGNDFSQAKAIISKDWGGLRSYGNFYMTQIEERWNNYAVGQVTVSYENVSVTYTLTFDEDMNLAGIYMK